MFLKSLATTTFFLWRGLLQCSTWWRYRIENCWRHNWRWTPSKSLQFRRMRKRTVPILHKMISTWYRFYGLGDLQHAPGRSLISFLMTTTFGVEQVNPLLAWSNSFCSTWWLFEKARISQHLFFPPLVCCDKNRVLFLSFGWHNETTDKKQ